MLIAEILHPTIHPVVAARAVLLLTGGDDPERIASGLVKERLSRLRARLRRTVERLATMRNRRDRLARKYRRDHPEVKEARRIACNLATRATHLRAAIREIEEQEAEQCAAYST